MAKSISVDQKRKRGRGRPATGRDPMVSARIPRPIIDKVDAYAAAQDCTRSKAIAQLVELGLSHSAKYGRLSHAARAHASAMATKVVDQLTDSTAPEEEQQVRKRKLIRGPREFREIRQDQHKAEPS